MRLIYDSSVGIYLVDILKDCHVDFVFPNDGPLIEDFSLLALSKRQAMNVTIYNRGHEIQLNQCVCEPIPVFPIGYSMFRVVSLGGDQSLITDVVLNLR